MITNKLAAKMLLVACLGLISACGLVFLPKAKATTILGNADPMSVACATNYLRRSPKVCMSTTAKAAFTFVDDTVNVCRTGTFASLPSSAVFAVLQMDYLDATATPGASLTMSYYLDSSCTTLAYTYAHRGMTENNRMVYQIIVPVTGTSLYYKAIDVTSTAFTLTGKPIAYYD